MSNGDIDTVMDLAEPCKVLPMEKASRGSSNQNQSKLNNFITLEQRIEIQEALEPCRGKRMAIFVADIFGALQKAGASHLHKAVHSILGDPDLGEGYESAIEQIKDSETNIIEIFSDPSILQYLETYAPRRQLLFPLGANQFKATEKAWDLPYIGRGVNLLRKAINDMNVERKWKQYSNFVPVVQSSGTGKSRTVDELARRVFTLPFNLRSPTDRTGYPKADPGVLDCLTLRTTAIQCHLLYNIFLGQLFEAVTGELAKMEGCTSSEALASGFYDWLKAERGNLYQAVITNTEREYLKAEREVAGIKSLALKPRRMVKQLNDLVDKTAVPVLESGSRLIELIKAKSGAPLNDSLTGRPVWLVLYFDESHTLTSMWPESDDGKGFSAYQILCSTLDRLKELDLFAIFLSTSSSICIPTCSMPQAIQSGATSGVQVPFIELPFDESEGGCLLEEDSHTMRDVSRPEFMIRFGRPLFRTRYKCGDPTVKYEIVDFACMKLAPGDLASNNNTVMLAVLNVRIGFSFDRSRKSVRDTSDKLVEGFMHLAFAGTEHGEYRYVCPPSEPILAEAAARLMEEHGLGGQASRLLVQWCDSGLLNKGDHGELAVRLILTRAHDRAILRRNPSSKNRHFSEPILLPEFLEALVGKTHARKILNATPDNVPGGMTLAQSSLGKAKLNFTYWGKAEDDSVMTDDAAWIALGRCMAWKCSDEQKDVDHITPLLLWDEKLGRYSVSAIFWQTKNRSRAQKVHIDAEEMGFFTLHEDSNHRANSRPYLTISLDLDGKAKHEESSRGVPTTNSQVSPDNRITSRDPPRHSRYAVTISGCSNTVYPGVITDVENDLYASLISSCGWLEEHPRRDPELLETLAQMKAVWGQREGAMSSYKGVKFNGDCRLVTPSDANHTKTEPIVVRRYPGEGEVEEDDEVGEDSTEEE